MISTKKKKRKMLLSQIRRALYILSDELLRNKFEFVKLKPGSPEFLNSRKYLKHLSLSIIKLIEKRNEIENEMRNISGASSTLIQHFNFYNHRTRKRRPIYSAPQSKNSLPPNVERWVKIIKRVSKNKFVDLVRALKSLEHLKEREGFALALNFSRVKRRWLSSKAYPVILGLIRETLELSVKKNDKDIISWLLNMSLTYYKICRESRRSGGDDIDNIFNERIYISEGLVGMRELWEDLRVWKSIFFDMMSNKFMDSDYMCSIFGNNSKNKNGRNGGNSDSEITQKESEETIKKNNNRMDELKNSRKKWKNLSPDEKKKANRELSRNLEVLLPNCIHLMLKFNCRDDLIKIFVTEICKFHFLDDDDIKRFYEMISDQRKAEEERIRSGSLNEMGRKIERNPGLEKSEDGKEEEEEDDDYSKSDSEDDVVYN